MTRRQCVVCGRPVTGIGASKYCVKCRAKLIICPQCGGPKRRQAKRCKNCFIEWLNKEFHARPEVIAAMSEGRSEGAKVNIARRGEAKSEESRRKMSAAQYRRFERDGPTLGVFKAGHTLNWDPEFRRKKAEGIARQRQSKDATRIEQVVSRWLTELGVVWEREKLLDTFVLDLWLPDYQAAIEVMGEHWHNLEAQQKRDARKRDLLEQAGVPLLELWGSQIHSGEGRQVLQDWLELLR